MTQTLGHEGRLVSDRSDHREPDLVTWLGGVLAVVAVLELTVLRIGTRTVIHIPGIEAFETPYRGISTLGRTAYFVAVVLLLAVLVAAVASLVSNRAVGAAVAVAGVLVAAVAARAELVGGEVVATLTVVCIAVLTARLAAHSAGLARVAVVVLGTAPVVALSTMVVVEVLGAGAGFERAGLTLGEGLAVVAAMLSPLLVRMPAARPESNGHSGSHTTARRTRARLTRAPRAAWIAAAVAGLGVLALILGAGSTTKILMLWNFGLSGYFPAPLYAFAAAAIAYTIAVLFTEDRRGTAVGLTLLLVGGIGLHSTYQTGLVVAGFALVDLSVIGAQRPGKGGTPPRAGAAPRASGDP